MRVFSVPLSVPFLRTVVAALVDGRLVDGFEARAQPERLARATLYLPTRRAGRMAREIFLEYFGRADSPSSGGKNLASILVSDLTQTGSTVCGFTGPIIAMPVLRISGKRYASLRRCRSRPARLLCRATASAR